MKIKIIILSTFILFSCISSTETQLPDGRIGHNLDCSGVLLSWDECGVQANEICPEGYTTISSNRKESYDTNRTMLIECKNQTK